MKTFKTILEIIFYLALVITFSLSLKLLLDNTNSAMYYILFISVSIMVIHQIKDDLTLKIMSKKYIKKRY